MIYMSIFFPCTKLCHTSAYKSNIMANTTHTHPHTCLHRNFPTAGAKCLLREVNSFGNFGRNFHFGKQVKVFVNEQILCCVIGKFFSFIFFIFLIFAFIYFFIFFHVAIFLFNFFKFLFNIIFISFLLLLTLFYFLLVAQFFFNLYYALPF